MIDRRAAGLLVDSPTAAAVAVESDDTALDAVCIGATQRDHDDGRTRRRADETLACSAANKPPSSACAADE